MREDLVQFTCDLCGASTTMDASVVNRSDIRRINGVDVCATCSEEVRKAEADLKAAREALEARVTKALEDPNLYGRVRTEAEIARARGGR